MSTTNATTAEERVYYCPMHRQVRETHPAKCPKCGMDLVPQGTRFAMLRHMASRPWLMTGMVIMMLAMMAFMISAMAEARLAG